MTPAGGESWPPAIIISKNSNNKKMSQQPESIKVKQSQTSDIKSSAPDFEQKINYDQGSEGGNMMFMLICNKVPVGTVVGFSSNTPGPNPPIELKPTMVTYPNTAIGIRCNVPANYSCVITYFANFKGTPPADASITFQVSYPVNE